MVLDGGQRKADNEYQDAAMELLDILASMAVKLVGLAGHIPARKQDWKHRRELIGPDGQSHGQVALHKSTSKALKSLDPASSERLVRQDVDGKHLWLLDDRRGGKAGRVQQARVLTDEQAATWLENNGYTVLHGSTDREQPLVHRAEAGEHLVVIGGHAHVLGPEKGKRPMIAADEASVFTDSQVKWKDLGGSTPGRIEVAEDGTQKLVEINAEEENARIMAAQAAKEQAEREEAERQEAEQSKEHGPRSGMVAPALLAAGAAATVASAAHEVAGPDAIGVDPGAATTMTTTTTTDSPSMN